MPGFVRISFANSLNILEKGMSRIKEFMDSLKMAPKVE